MRRILLWLGGALIAGALAWTAGWFIGRSAVDDRLDMAAQELEAKGWTLTYGVRQITGFPFGYDVTLRDVGVIDAESGVLIRVPLAVADRDDRPDWLRVSLPEGVQMDVPTSVARRQANPDLPPTLRYAATGSAIVLLVPEAAPETSQELTADRLSVSLSQDDYPYGFTFDAETLKVVRAQATGALDLTASRAALEMQGQEEAGPQVSMVVAAEDLDLGLLSDVAFGAPLRELIYGGGPGGVEVGYKAAALSLSASLADDPAGMDGTYEANSETAEGVVSVSGGLLDVEASIGSTSWTWQAAGAPALSVQAASGAFRLAGPIARSDTPGPGQVRATLNGVTGDEAFWGVIDSDAHLNRDPASLKLAVDSTLRLMGRIDRLPPGLAPPFEISNLIIDEVAVSALGATARATGDIEIVQPVVVPTGEIAVEATGVLALGDDLAGAGLIDPEMLTTLRAILELYARPGEAPDSWVTEIETGQEGLRVNGQPVQ